MLKAKTHCQTLLPAVAAGAFGCLAAFVGTAAVAASTPKVVVTTKPAHALVAAVMAGVGEPKLLVDGAASPHTFSLKPSGARAINEADVFIRVSEGVEPFTHKIVDTLPKAVTLVTLAETAGVTLLDQRKGGAFEAHAHHHDDHDDHDNHDAHADHDDDDEHAGKDGHIWLDVANAKAIVDNVSAALSAKYPDHAAAFAANAAATQAKLDALKSEIDGVIAPVRARPFIVFHDATQYFEKGFGLAAAGSITVSPDVQPSGKRLTEVRKKISSLEAACVFAEPGYQPKLLNAVTEGTKAKTGTLDAEGALLAPGPDLYFTLMRGLAHNMADCLK